MFDRSKIIGLGACALLLSGAQSLAQPASWKPGKGVEVVSSVAKGGGTDATARLLQRMLRERQLVDAPVAVVNKSDGGGAETWRYLGEHAADGHYLAISTPPLLTVAHTGAAEFTPLTILYNEYVLVAVRADSPIRDGRDLAARLKRDASSISLGVAPSLGSHNHVVPALVARAAGGEARKMRVQVFATGAAAADAVIEGRVDVVSSTVGTLLSRVRSGKLRPLAISASKRLGGPLAAVPTWREQGIDVVLPTWRGVIGPPGMPPAQIAYWEDIFLKLSLDSDWLAEMSKQWWDGIYMSSAETRKFLDEQTALLNGVLADLGLAGR